MDHPATIAIVDDDDSVRLALESLVRSMGYEARMFASAEETLQSADLRHAACLIADIQMPGMSGAELQEALREQGNTIPVLFITAFPEDHTRDRVLKAGALCCLAKPFDSNVLLDWLRIALDGGSRRAQP